MKVLIVDDENLVRKSLSRAAKIRGHETAEAENGKVAEEIWRSFDPDLVYLDILMPERSGPELLKIMGKTSAKVIMMSAFSGEYDSKKAQLMGADAFCPKPFDDIFKIIELGEELGGGRR